MKNTTSFKTALLPVLFVSFLCFTYTSFGQPKKNWQQVAQTSSNFYEIKAAFMQENAAQLVAYEKDQEDLAAGRINQIPKGKYPGIKQFLRMANWYEPRVKESNGDLLTVGQKDIAARIDATNAPQSINAANWIMIGPEYIPTNTGIGRVNNLRIDPNNANILYACTPASQLFKSTDAGVTWNPISNGIPATGVTDLAIDPTNSNILYAVTGDGDQSLYHPFSAGLYKSTNGGTSWSPTGLSYSQGNYVGLSSIIIHPTSTNTILVSGTNGIRRSTDGGATFTQTSTLAMQNLVFKPGSPNVVFAGSKYNGIFLRSADNGVTWTQITTGLPAGGAADRFAIDVSPANPDYVYAMASNFSYAMQGFYCSIDGGLTFKQMATTPNIGAGQAWYDFAVAADPVSAATVYACGVDVFKSIDTGKTWVNTTRVYTGGTTHPDMHDLTFQGATTLYLANDGGVYKTTDAGTSWTNLSSNLSIAQPYAIGLSATNPNTIIMGTQDNGTILTNNLTSWRLTRGGDGMIGFIDRTNDNNMYSSSQNGGLVRSINGGASWLGATTGLTGTRYWVTPYMQDPVAPATIYCGTDKVFKSTNGAATWTAISPSFTTVRWLDVDKNNNQIMYAMTDNTVQKTTNGGTNWAPAASGIPGGVELLHIHIDVNNSSILYLSTASYTGNSLYRSTDAGATWVNWGTGLPNVPANTVVTVVGSTGEVYCGTDIGVYYRNTAAGSWTAFNTNLPVVPVRDLEIYYPSGALRAGTFGRGIWETQLNVPICGFTSGILYVNKLATGTNKGTSWANAYTDLKTAIDAIPAINASNCNVTQIRVAAGTYKPTAGTDRNTSFSLTNNFAIYGGFAGNEPANYDLSLRNFTTNTTILSGEIGAAGNADNSYNVIRNMGNSLNSTAILDGFTITAGNANGGNIIPSSNLNCGGGMYNSQSSPSIINSIFTGNTALGSSGTGGGGMFNYNNASPVITKCSFISNTANSGGGGLFNYSGCSPTISNCTFTSNTSSGNGGGINNNSSANPTITNCSFLGNSAAGGGGLYNISATPIVINCVFIGNNGGGNGGAIFQNNASATLTNCSFSGNLATSGAAFKNAATVGLIVATNIGNSIFWGDGGTEIVTANTSFGDAVTNVTYSIVQGGYAGTGNLNLNPDFMSQPPPALGTSGNLHLLPCSAGINTGNDAANPTTLDLDELPRKFGTMDMGAYEYQSAKVTPPAIGPDVTVYKNCFGETTNLTTLFNTIGLTATWNTANTTTAPPGTYRLVVSNAANCTDTAFAFVILEVATWTGTISNDWNTPGNWNINKVPGNLTHVIVPGSTPNPCYVNIAGAVAASIQVRNGGNIRTTSTRSVTVNGKCLVLPPN